MRNFQNGFVNIFFVVLIAVVIGVAGYSALNTFAPLPILHPVGPSASDMTSDKNSAPEIKSSSSVSGNPTSPGIPFDKRAYQGPSELREKKTSSVDASKYITIKNENLTTEKTVLVLVDETVLPYLKEELENYTEDIKKELGLDTYVKSVSSAEDIRSLKSYVLDFLKKGDLNGVLLVGNVPTGYFYHPDVPEKSVFTVEGAILGDFIYQDVLNACEFSPERNAFSYKSDECQTGITVQPYWVARLTPNSSKHSDVELLKDYFKRNHEFRNGLYSFKQEALLYSPALLDFTAKGAGEIHRIIDGVRQNITGSEQQQIIINKIKQGLSSFDIYPAGKYKFVDIFSPSSDNEYLSELQKGYETLLFNGHGMPLFHQKDITLASQIQAKFFFGDFRSCSVGRFTTKDYLAGEYLFSGGLVILAASTPVFSSPYFDAELSDMLANGAPFYKAIEWSGVGGNLLGDPTLRMRYKQKMSSQSQIEVMAPANPLIFSKAKPIPKFIIENVSDSPLYFNVLGKYLQQKGISALKNFTFSNLPDFTTMKYVEERDKYVLGPHQKTVMGTVLGRPSDCCPYEKVPPGIYKGKYFIISSDEVNPLITIDVSFDSSFYKK